MREFKRITIDPSVKNGLPCIRDTTIPIHEIVKQTSANSSFQEIMTQYPELSIDDIYEAMAYALNQVTTDVAFWRSEGLTPLTSVKGFSQILLGKHGYDASQLSEDVKHNFIENILTNAQRAAANWWNLGNWIRMNYEARPLHWETQTATEIVDLVAHHLPDYEPTAAIKFRLSENLPKIKSNGYLYTAIINLIAERISRLKNQATVEISQSAKDSVTFSIFRPFEDVLDTEDLERLFSIGSLQLAAIIIQQHGGEIQTSILTEGVVFRFQIPVSS